MSELYARLYLDEDVDILIADLVRSRSFEVTTTNDVGRKGKSDPEQLEYAANRKLTIVTYNRIDFERLAQQHFAVNRIHYGIIIAVQRLPGDIAERLAEKLNDFTADEMINQIIYI